MKTELSEHTDIVAEFDNISLWGSSGLAGSETYFLQGIVFREIEKLAQWLRSWALESKRRQITHFCPLQAMWPGASHSPRM